MTWNLWGTVMADSRYHYNNVCPMANPQRGFLPRRWIAFSCQPTNLYAKGDER